VWIVGTFEVVFASGCGVGRRDVSRVEVFWNQARVSLGGSAPVQPPEAWTFGDSADLADELLALVLAGTKTATSSALWEYEADHEPLPQVGELSLLLDGAGVPRCVIETTEVAVVPMDQVDAAFAAAEGEGDRTLTS
jgi:histidinol-phosphate aminotransferase